MTHELYLTTMAGDELVLFPDLDPVLRLITHKDGGTIVVTRSGMKEHVRSSSRQIMDRLHGRTPNPAEAAEKESEPHARDFQVDIHRQS